MRLTIIAYLCDMGKKKDIYKDSVKTKDIEDLLNGKRILELETALIKSEAELQGYKEGEKAKSGTDYTKYIVMGIAAVEGLVIILERIV